MNMQNPHHIDSNVNSGMGALLICIHTTGKYLLEIFIEVRN